LSQLALLVAALGRGGSFSSAVRVKTRCDRCCASHLYGRHEAAHSESGSVDQGSAEFIERRLRAVVGLEVGCRPRATRRVLQAALEAVTAEYLGGAATAEADLLH